MALGAGEFSFPLEPTFTQPHYDHIYTYPHAVDIRFPDQRLTRVEALRGMTIDAAYASFAEETLGSLVPGKRADMTVLSQDIMSVPAGEIMASRVLATIIDGRVVFGKV